MDFIRDVSAPPASRFPDPENTTEFWLSYFRHPRHDLAEQVISLRRLRGMTQAELAARIGTQQPAIARIEAALANVGLDTVRSLAVALDAVVRLDMKPAENCVYTVALSGSETLFEWPPVDVDATIAGFTWVAEPEVKMLPVKSEAIDDANMNMALGA